MSFARLRLILVVAALGLGMAGAYVWSYMDGRGRNPSLSDAVGGPWALTTADGKNVKRESFSGKVQILYFGYLSCPDVCPTELQVMADTLDRLENQALEVQALFVTIDPERDLPPLLGEYTAAFDKRILGLTGTEEQIKEMSRLFRVYYGKVDNKNNSKDYIIDHSNLIYITDRKGQVSEIIAGTINAERVADAVKRVLSY